MPFANEHSARLLDPNSTPHDRVRRTHGSGNGTIQGIKVPDTIDVIWFIEEIEDGEDIVRPQALRFPLKKWKSKKAKKWLKNNDIDYISFEKATNEKQISMSEKIDFSKKSKKLFDFLIKNEKTLIAQKKAEMKRADAIVCPMSFLNKNNLELKTNESFNPDSDRFKVRIIINTTNILDSHGDVHIDGLWKKSLLENKMIMHLQEHNMKFESIISDGDDLKAYTKYYNWKELGFDFEGETQALVFDSIIKSKRNPYMFDQYSKGYVRNHSVGMKYVKLALAVNDENNEKYFEIWEKYYDKIANKALADEKGFFWAVTEAKLIEGSAVPLGSNITTITIENNLKEPLLSTQQIDIEPSNDTHRKFYYELIKIKK